MPQPTPASPPHTAASAPQGWSRRNVLGLGLKALSLGVAGLALEACGQAAWAQGRSGLPQIRSRSGAPAGPIVVVGAGVAGLVCAEALQRAGHEVQVYEANGRVGGRVRTAFDGAGPGRHVELGAEFFDQGNTVLLNLARRLGLGLLDMESPQEGALDPFVLRFGGQRQGWEALQASLRGPIARWQADAKRLPEHLGPQSSAAAKALDAQDMRGYLNATGAQGWGRAYLEALLTTEFGLDPEKLSAAEFLRYFPSALGLEEEEGAERFKLEGGNESLPQALAKALKRPVLLNHPLVGIAQEGGAYRLRFKGPNGPVSVLASQVVLALPMTLLRRLQLDLPVPVLQREAWAQCSHGTNAKLVLGTEARPWRQAKEAGGFASDGAVARLGWDATRGRAEGPGALTVFMGGQLGEGAQRQGWAALADRAIAELGAVFPGLAQARPRFAHGVAWADEPWALCSYASWGPGEASRFGAVAGASVGGVHFAGEHLGGAWRGHMEGAARSGLAAAEAVKQALRA